MVGTEGAAWLTLKVYSGNGSLTLLFLASVIYLWITEKDRWKRSILVYTPLTLLVLFFLPFVSDFVANVMEEAEIFYRFLWTLPMGTVIAYATVKCISGMKKKWLQIGVVLLLAAYIMVGGHLVYKSPQFSKAQNLYQIPDAVIHICDAIEMDGREVAAAFPHELVQYVRQYSAYVVMPYGYDALVERWGLSDELELEMRKEISNAERLAVLARERACPYLVINQNHMLEGSLEEQDFVLVLQTDGYDVYLDSTADMWTVEEVESIWNPK